MDAELCGKRPLKHCQANDNLLPRLVRVSIPREGKEPILLAVSFTIPPCKIKKRKKFPKLKKLPGHFEQAQFTTSSLASAVQSFLFSRSYGQDQFARLKCVVCASVRVCRSVRVFNTLRRDLLLAVSRLQGQTCGTKRPDGFDVDAS